MSFIPLSRSISSLPPTLNPLTAAFSGSFAPLGTGFLPISGLPPSTERYHFNGIDTYITIPPLEILVGSPVQLEFVAPTSWAGNDTRTFFDGVDGSIEKTGSNAFFLNQYTGLLDGVPIDNGVTLVPSDGQSHTVTLTKTGLTGYIDTLGAQSGGAFREINFPMFNFSGGGRFYPINDGWSANPVIADTLGGQDGTAINFVESGWKSVAEVAAEQHLLGEQA